MRDGRLRGSHAAACVSRDTIVAEMVGNAVNRTVHGHSRSIAGVALEVRNLSVRDSEREQRRRARVEQLSFTLGNGEILGLFGLLGAGCNEAALAVFGAWGGFKQGQVLVAGHEVDIRRPEHAIRHGIGLMAQDRRDTLLPDHVIADNIALASLQRFSRWGFLDVTAIRKLATGYVARLRIKAPSVLTRVAVLSGGNQQKVQVARWLASGARILLLIDPTRGVDIGTRSEINTLWQQLADDGYAILLISSEAEELVEVCDRVLVLRNGRQVSEHTGEQISEERLLRAAAGF
jgi:ABC-type sugar transport system ATPase subunit